MPRQPRHAPPHFVEDPLTLKVRPLIRHRLAGAAAAHGRHRRQHGKVYIAGGWGAMLLCLPLAWTVAMYATGLIHDDVGPGTRIIHGPTGSPPAIERLQPADGQPSITTTSSGDHDAKPPSAPTPTPPPPPNGGAGAAPPATTAPAPVGSTTPTVSCPPGRAKKPKSRPPPSMLPVLPVAPTIPGVP